MVQTVADEYGVDSKNVNADVDYEVTGSFTVNNAESTKQDSVTETIRNSISEQTDVPVGDINVTYNPETGSVEYTVETDSYNKSNDIKGKIGEEAFSEVIATELTKIDSDINISSPVVSDKISVDIDIVVDGKGSVDTEVATNNLSSDFTKNGFTVENADGIFTF